MSAEPRCSKRRCQWYLGVVLQNGAGVKGVHVCAAFPDGIPAEIAYGANKHEEVMEGQVKSYTYTKAKKRGRRLTSLPPEDPALGQGTDEERSTAENGSTPETGEDNGHLETLRDITLDLVAGHQWKKARLIAEQLTNATPDDPLTHLLLGITLMEMGELAEAEEEFGAGMKLDPEEEITDNFIFMARLCCRRGDFEGQLRWAGKAERSGDTEAYLIMADAHERLGGRTNAEETLRKALKKHPRDVRARSMLGRLYLSAGKPAKAVDQFRSALKVDADNPGLWADLGCALKGMGLQRNAVDAFLHALSLEPKNSLRHYDVGDTYLSMGDHDRAAAFLTAALQLDPGFALAHYDLGLAYLESGKYEQSLRESVAALRQDPGMESQETNLGLGAVTNMAVAYLRQEEYREAENALRKNLKLFAPTYYNLGLALFKQHRYEEALPNLQRAVELEPDDPEYLDLLGNAYGEVGMLEEAEGAFRRAIGADTLYALGHYDLGWILAKQDGRYREALQCFKCAIALNEDLPWAYYSIACIYAGRGKKKAALAFFEKALQKGLDDRAHIDSDPDLESLRDDPRFRQLMERHFPVHES